MARWSSLEVKNQLPPRYFQAGAALNRFLLEAPYLARCSDDKTATKVRPRQYALKQPYMQVNRAGMVSWLIFDLDHTNPDIWEDAFLPPPNLVVIDKDTSHSHLFYAIPPVCTTVRARSKPIEYMRAVYEAMAIRLNADLQFHSGPVAKTPGHHKWVTSELHGKVYELGQLAEYVELIPRRWSKAPAEDYSNSRHCNLFNELRKHAYLIVKQEKANASFEHFVAVLEKYSLANNARFSELAGKAEELQWSSIKATVKSVARWTWDRYTGRGDCNRGVMGLEKQMPLRQKQRLAALRTHEVRAKTTEARIRAACQNLRACGKEIAINAVARTARLSRQTVATYRHVIDEILKPVLKPLTRKAALSKAASALSKRVKYGVHQVVDAFEEGLGAPQNPPDFVPSG